jgi:hypothetical protein
VKITTWAHGVVTGRIAHWNDINNQLVADIWPAIEAMAQPQQRLWKNAVVSALGIMEKMLGPDRGLKGILGVDLKKVNRDQTEALYADLIGAFISETLRIKPSLTNTLTAEYAEIAGCLGVRRRALEPPTCAIENVADSLWDRLTEIVASPRQSDPRAIFELKAMFMSHANQNMS